MPCSFWNSKCLRAAHRLRALVDRGDGLRVVGGEHRVERIGRLEHAARAGEVADTSVFGLRVNTG